MEHLYGMYDNYKIHESYKILPLVYDEALSYWEQIVSLYGKVNELIKIMQTYGIEWQEGDAQTLAQAVQYADSITSAFRTEFADLSGKVETALNDLSSYEAQLSQDMQTQFENLKTQVDKDIADFGTNIADLWLAMNYLYYQQDAQYAKIYAALKSYIDQTVAQTTGAAVNVINPAYGSVTSLNKALQDILDYMQTIGSITMKQYDEINITMEEYDAMQITAADYQRKAYFIFFDRIQLSGLTDYVNTQFSFLQNQITENHDKLYMTNRFTGKKDYIGSILNMAIGDKGTSPTMSEYKYFNLTMEEYSDSNTDMEFYRTEWLPYMWSSKLNLADGADYQTSVLKTGWMGDFITILLMIVCKTESVKNTPEKIASASVSDYWMLSTLISTPAGANLFYHNMNMQTVEMDIYFQQKETQSYPFTIGQILIPLRGDIEHVNDINQKGE